jgi:amidohydrolase
MEKNPGNTSKISARINELTNDLKNQQIETFRWLHQNPELALQEFKSSRFILKHLQELSNIEIVHPISKTGIKAILRGNKPGPTVALRADIDAIPVREETGLSYASKVKTNYHGMETYVSHACGHDANTAAALGVAAVLNQIKDELYGTVVFIFQPAEEGVPPGEDGGAALMVKEGVLKNPDVDAIFSFHANSMYYPGTVIIGDGITHASMDNIIIKIKGVQAHGSQPWKAKDPIIAGSAIINAIQTIISRDVDLQKGAAVITAGYFHGGVKVNIIPDEAEIGLTVRSLNDDNHELLMRRVKEVAELEAQVHGCYAEVIYGQHYPINRNNPDLYQLIIQGVKEFAGTGNLVKYLPKTTSEDFSYFSQQVPGLYIQYGSAPIDKPLSESKPNHHPEFMVDEAAIKFVTRLECQLIINALKKLHMSLIKGENIT